MREVKWKPFSEIKMIWRWSLLEVWLGLILVSTVLADPKGYGSYDYDGHGHHGYNEIGYVNKVVDYHAKPQYAFGYEVEDYYQKLSHGRWEVRDGDVTQGQYRVLLPDGRIQIVSYIADKGGYRPTIQYIGKGEHPPPPPAYANVHPPKHFQLHDHHVPQHYEPEIIPVPVLEKAIPPPQIAPLPHLGPGPFKLDVNALDLAPVGGHGHGYGHGYGDVYGHGHGHGYGGSGGDALVFGPSSQEPVAISPAKLSRKRALLYDKTLFRKDFTKNLISNRQRV